MDTTTPEQEPEVKRKKTVGQYTVKALKWTGGVIGATVLAASVATYKILWPPRIRKYAKIAGAVTFGLAVTHPGTTYHIAVEHIGKPAYSEIRELVTDKKGADKVKSEAQKVQENAYQLQKEKEGLENKLTEEQKKTADIQNMQKKLQEVLGITTTYQGNVMKKIDAQIDVVKQLKNENENLSKKVDSLEYKLDEKIKEPEANNEPKGTDNAYTSQLREKPSVIARPVRPVREYVPGNNAANNITNASAMLPSTLQAMQNRLSSEYNFLIYVNKKENELSLYKNSAGKLELEEKFPCSTGTNPGQKIELGDKATPEGIFQFAYRNFSSGLSPLYGAGIVGLETGEHSGIVLCGTDLSERVRAIERHERCTNGGIITMNQDLLKIDEIVGSDYSRVLAIIENPSRPLVR